MCKLKYVINRIHLSFKRKQSLHSIMNLRVSLEIIYMSSMLFSLSILYKSFSVFISLIFDRLFVFCYRFINLFFRKRGCIQSFLILFNLSINIRFCCLCLHFGNINSSKHWISRLLLSIYSLFYLVLITFLAINLLKSNFCFLLSVSIIG